jgi:D-arginine dehydrogenase
VGDCYDVIIIGAGVSGASIAAELSSARRVALLEMEAQPGYHSTGRSAAAFIPSYGVECDVLRPLTLASAPFFQTNASGAVAVDFLKRRGLVTIASDGAVSDVPALCKALSERIPGGVSPISRDQALALLPSLKSGWSSSATYEPDVFDMDVDAIHQFFLATARRHGGELFCNAAVKGLNYVDGLWHVETESSLFKARTIVNAAGAWSGAIGALAGAIDCGLTPMRRTALTFSLTEGESPDDWPLVLEYGGSFYLKPDAGQVLLSLADETPSAPCDAQPEELDIALAVHNMQQAFDIDVRRINHSWAGLRTFTSDRVPVFGYDPEMPSFFWAAGHGGHGIQIAPAAARVCGALINNQPIPIDILELGFDQNLSSPTRFVAQKNRKQTLN